MPRDFLTLDDVELQDRLVLLRVDLNSSVDPLTRRLMDDTRLRRHAETVRELAEKGARTVLLAHQSRPGNDDFVSLVRHARRMQQLVQRRVRFTEGIFGRSARQAIRRLKAGELLMLENIRFNAEEVLLKRYNGSDFRVQATAHLVQRLAPLADLFVNDAFAAAHRCQPSLVGFAEMLPTVAGRVMERELASLDRALSSGKSPRLALLGGSKAEDSVAMARHFLASGIDTVLTGGVVANVFLLAAGIDIGEPSRAFIAQRIPDWESVVGDASALLEAEGDRLVLPQDVALDDGGTRRGVPVSALPTPHPVHDIGLDTMVGYIARLRAAGTIIANGPMGLFEAPALATGTREVFRAVAESEAYSVVGGGETSMAFARLGLADGVNHISTGGGSCIAYLAGRPMPVLDALRRSRELFIVGAYGE